MKKIIKQKVKSLDREITKKYKDKYNRYEKLYEYISDLEDNEVWYVRNIKATNIASTRNIGVFTTAITCMTFFLTMADELMKKIGTNGYGAAMVVIAVIVLFNVIDIFRKLHEKQYIIKVMEDIEKDKKIYDEHGICLNRKLLEQLKSNR